MTSEPIIAGAGPIGLAAGLFLARRGIRARIIEPRTERSTQSRALAVNPRTLDLLAETGLTERMLGIGGRMRGAILHLGEKAIARVELEGAHPRYPFLLALSQAVTEHLLEDALEAEGVRVERGRELVTCRTVGDGVEVEIADAAGGGGGGGERVSAAWVLGADGAHSVVRHKSGIAFEGSSLRERWHLVDVPLRTDLSSEHGHIILLGGGAFVFLIRVVTGEPEGEYLRWRVFTNRPDPLSHLVMAERAGDPVWASAFTIGHRCAASFASGRAYLAGDAAHIHSPIGARGMNLGIEDAAVFARLAAAGRLDEYDGLRRPVDRRVVRTVGQITRIVAAETAGAKLLRTLVLPRAVRLRAARGRMRRTVTGLDHRLDVPGLDFDGVS
ncbi:MAG: FAD-dependent monooxygenase [Phycisphaeraceae bacterium]|nr:MAG: FAD-dependent monooxygenase [Phycisphaeraceae bacterium]